MRLQVHQSESAVSGGIILHYCLFSLMFMFRWTWIHRFLSLSSEGNTDLLFLWVWCYVRFQMCHFLSQGGPGHLYLLKNKVATFAKVEKEEDMSQLVRSTLLFLSQCSFNDRTIIRGICLCVCGVHAGFGNDWAGLWVKWIQSQTWSTSWAAMSWAIRMERRYVKFWSSKSVVLT